jgi:hypothetical protein
MKDIFCVAAFAGKLLGLIVFVSTLRPDSIVTVQASMAPAHCQIERSRMQGCGLDASAVAPVADVRPCSIRPRSAHC